MNKFFFANRSGNFVHIRLTTDTQVPPRFVLTLNPRPDTNMLTQGLTRSLSHGIEAHPVPELDAVARRERKIVVKNHVPATSLVHLRDDDGDFILIITSKN